MASQLISFIPRTVTRNRALTQGSRCCCNQNHRMSQTQLSKANNGYNKIKIHTLDNCKMNISQYSLLYNGQGGRGTGSLVKVKEEDFDTNAPLRFEADLRTVHIPPVTNKTAKFLGQVPVIPLPPLSKVDVVPETIKADIYIDTGKVELMYKANLWLSIGSGYKAPPLLVDMTFTTEEVKTALRRSTRGKRLDKYGRCKLVGLARVDPIDDQFINSAIGLPSDCVTSLNVNISFF